MTLAETPRKNAAQEYALVELMERLARYSAGRIAVHIHLSHLAPHHRRANYLRLAFTTFDNAVSQREGQTFLLRNNDIVFVGQAVDAQYLEDSVIRLRYLFSEDPLIQLGDTEEANFCTWYVLENDYAAFLDTCRRMHKLASTALPNHLTSGGPARTPIDPKSLARLEELLSGTDLSNLIRNQPVCALEGAKDVSPLFHEVYVSIADLEETLMPLVQISGNPWLFQYVTQLLDKRMLAHISRAWSDERSFSINLNISTLLSNEFLKFDQQISIAARGRVVIELQKVDIFADMGAYIFAREYCRDRGYRLCLDGITHLTLPFIDREKLGLDMVKLFWSPELETAENTGQLAKLRDCIAAFGAARVILARCESETAIKVGRSLGINLFQGRYINGLVQQQQRSAALQRARG